MTKNRSRDRAGSGLATELATCVVLAIVCATLGCSGSAPLPPRAVRLNHDGAAALVLYAVVRAFHLATGY